MQRDPQEHRTPSVADVMRRRFVTASPEEALPQVRQTMRLARLRHLVITDGDQLLGLISYRNLLESLLEGENQETAIAAAMTESPVFVTPATPIADAADRLCRYGFGCLPVVEESAPRPRIVGLVTESDLLRVAFRR
jgi:CBS domain-containing protein